MNNIMDHELQIGDVSIDNPIRKKFLYTEHVYIYIFMYVCMYVCM